MILVFGRTGQVATELGKLPDTLCLGRDQADLTDPAACAAAIRTRMPAAVINAAAYTAVDAAETDADTARIVNAKAPAVIATTCAELGAPLVHLSTDYVFDGSGDRPFPSNAPTGPLNVYGCTKLTGEDAVRTAGGTYALLRTSWVFSAHGSNFVKTMLRLSETRDTLNIVDDQIGGPTPAKAIATACLTIAEALIADPRRSGTYHFTGAPDVSWADFARTIFAEAGRRTNVTGIPTTEYPTPAQRPLNSRLDCSTTETTFGLPRPDWRDALPAILKDTT
ncbi:dTDP-4-dehydrorhamnose reductase [Rhodobacteraceae bacterium THAF1]|uniref:dTDP-4-dehydrorhamnose reductase n=1 Tax=Palleronia sp. THAF1 TaxID=2587842 RepID=UPI000F3CC440|nr:dTDP-4-dehydrorhamnose reductase [Palleronia sp. THAF1]QFU10247.1 dTDP-4-dehydrorhamnose reductase [Palleronia sp. THAF1]VDC16848.1 dTDP-4-dehydrorhamnose reductase [Rhodobacteraceae bacterium THAF1]